MQVSSRIIFVYSWYEFIFFRYVCDMDGSHWFIDHIITTNIKFYFAYTKPFYADDKFWDSTILYTKFNGLDGNTSIISITKFGSIVYRWLLVVWNLLYWWTLDLYHDFSHPCRAISGSEDVPRWYKSTTTHWFIGQAFQVHQIRVINFQVVGTCDLRHFHSSWDGGWLWKHGAISGCRRCSYCLDNFVYLLRTTNVIRHHLGDPPKVPVDKQVSALNCWITTLGRLRRWRRACTIVSITKDSILMPAAGAHQWIGPVTRQSCGCRANCLGTQKIFPSVSDHVLNTRAETAWETSSCIIHSRCLLQNVKSIHVHGKSQKLNGCSVKK